MASRLKGPGYWANEGTAPCESDQAVLGDRSSKWGTEQDQRGMARMGKKQELRRQFKFLSITGYATILSCSWEFAMINIVITLTNGGKAGSIWELVVAIVTMFCVAMSFAEMGSIAPTAAGQYHWCSEFAPASMQKGLSFFVGVFCALGWQTSLAAACYVSAQQITAMITLAHPTFSATNWQTFLLSLAITIVVFAANTLIFRKLPLIETVLAVVHVVGFVAIIAVLWTTGSRDSVSNVFTNFQGENGWPTTGTAFLVGLTGPVSYLTNADSNIHLSEEVENSAWVVPRSMVVTAVFNYILSFITVVTLMFCIDDSSHLIDSPIGQPYLVIIKSATGSTAGTIVLGAIMLILIVSCAINSATTLSRQIWSFARDGGTPFSGWLSQVKPGWDIPINAMAVSIVFTVALNLIAMGSTVAYTMLTALNVSGLLTSYVVCISCMLYRRLYGDPLPPSTWQLGKSGVVFNGIAILFLAVIWVFQFFPARPSPHLADMNWGCVIYTFVFVVSAVYYVAVARFRYHGPVTKVRDS